MPHLTIEYTNNLESFNPAAVLSALNTSLAATGHFDEIDIKSRTIRLDSYLVGTSGPKCAFVHLTLAMMPRTEEMKRSVSALLLDRIKQLCACPTGMHLQLSVEIRDLDGASYAKATIAG